LFIPPKPEPPPGESKTNGGATQTYPLRVKKAAAGAFNVKPKF